MERVALQKLIDWNNNPRKKPLIVICSHIKVASMQLPLSQAKEKIP